MSNPPHPAAGYYPDPASGNQIRYWDGRAWADGASASPAPGTPYGAVPGPAGGPTSPYGYAGSPEASGGYGASSYGSPSGPSAPGGYAAPAGYGTPEASAQGGYGSPGGYSAPGGYGTPGASAPGGYGTPGGYSPGGAYGSAVTARRTSPLIVLGVVAVVLLAAVGGIWFAVRQAGRPPEPVGEVGIGSPTTGTVPSDGSWATSFTVTDAGVYLLTATSDEDLTLELYDQDGSLAENDDSGVLDSYLDPLVATYLQPGEYIVEVDTYSDRNASAELRVTAVPEAVELTVGTPATLTTSGTEPWVGYALIDPAASVSVDVRSDGPDDDLAMVVGSAGESEYLDDADADGPSSNPYDPYLETGRTGYVVLLVSPRISFDDEDLSATVVVTR